MSELTYLATLTAAVQLNSSHIEQWKQFGNSNSANCKLRMKLLIAPVTCTSSFRLVIKYFIRKSSGNQENLMTLSLIYFTIKNSKSAIEIIFEFDFLPFGFCF